jgi:dTDP-4-amino-4,6-dideoxygalactose transaminase
MRDIQMVDLKVQYEKAWPEIESALKSVFESAAFIKGSEVKKFEQELQDYLGVKHVVTCANGTDALQIALMARGLKPGDEVITTDFTFIATIEVAALLGLKLVLVDPDPESFNITPEAIRKAITPKTKVIIPVHLFGQCADMENIMPLADEQGIFVIEDTAQATGADYWYTDRTVRKAGTMGHTGATSFFPSKNLGCCGDGGALYTNNDQLAAKFRSISNHGMKVKYYHEDIGVNSRLDTLQAAILRVNLERLDRYNETRRKAAAFYDKALAGCPMIRIPARVPFSTHIFHQYTIKVSGGRRDELRDYLGKKKIPSMIYYPLPLHLQEAYKYLGYKKGDFPVTETLCSEVLSLPVHPEIEQEQIEYITTEILKFFS